MGWGPLLALGEGQLLVHGGLRLGNLHASTKLAHGNIC